MTPLVSLAAVPIASKASACLLVWQGVSRARYPDSISKCLLIVPIPSVSSYVLQRWCMFTWYSDGIFVSQRKRLWSFQHYVHSYIRSWNTGLESKMVAAATGRATWASASHKIPTTVSFLFCNSFCLRFVLTRTRRLQSGFLFLVHHWPPGETPPRCRMFIETV